MLTSKDQAQSKYICLFLPLTFSMVLVVLASAPGYEKEVKGIYIVKEQLSLSLFRDMVVDEEMLWNL